MPAFSLSPRSRSAHGEALQGGGQCWQVKALHVIDHVPPTTVQWSRRSTTAGGGMRRSEQRILTTHTGSLPRPAALLDSRGGASHDALLRDSVADIVRQQLEVGLDVGNDGEFGKSSLAASALEASSGSGI